MTENAETGQVEKAEQRLGLLLLLLWSRRLVGHLLRNLLRLRLLHRRRLR